MSIDDFLFEISSQGFVRFKRSEYEDLDIDLLTSRLECFNLELRRDDLRGNSSSANSLSGRHGNSEFPLHTDHAWSERPPRYVFILGASDRKARTTVLPLQQNNITADEFGGAVFSIEANSKRKYHHLYRKDRGLNQIRFNPDIMKPANSKAKAFIRLLSAVEIQATQTSFEEDHGIAFDNWSCLHGRSQVDTKAPAKRIGFFYK
jgi:hypothetical protein